MRYKLTNRLAECLDAKGVKKSQLAYWLKMSRSYVTRLVRGEIGPSIETALRIASYFKKTVEEIFQLVEEDTKQGNFPVVRVGDGAFVFVKGDAKQKTNKTGKKYESKTASPDPRVPKLARHQGACRLHQPQPRLRGHVTTG
jgi:putative transcriptional regulator